MFFNQYPYLNLNDLNLDYILKAIGEMKYEVTNFVSINAIKYADPIQWDITSQYEKNTIVIDPVTGTAYISVAPVPAGVALTRPEYWTVVFDLGSFVTRAAQNFTSRWESETTTTATFATNTGEWLVWGDVLYKAITNITAGDTYVVGSNIEHFTIEDLYTAYLNTIAQILAMVGDLSTLSTADKSSLVAAINEIANKIDFYITPDNFAGTDAQKLQAAFNYFSDNDTDGGTIIINRNYEVDSDILINKFAGTASDSFITVISLGSNNQINMNGYTIKAAAHNYRGGFTFENVHFIGTGDLFDTEHLIRMKFINCRFEKFNRVIHGKDFVQQYYFTNCYFEDITDAIFLDECACYALTFFQCDFEHLASMFSMSTNASIESLQINGCVIERCTSSAITFNSKIIRNCKIEGCYFESNALSIDLSNVISGQYCDEMQILYNTFNLPNDGVGIRIPTTTYKLSDRLSQKIVVIKGNTTIPNGNVSRGIIELSGSVSNHAIWYDMDILEMGFDISSNIYRSAHQYTPRMTEFSFELTSNATAGSTIVLLTSTELENLTRTGSYHIIIQCRNGYFPAVYTRNPNSGAIIATLVADASAGTYTFNMIYEN